MFVEDLRWGNAGELGGEGHYKKRHSCAGVGRGEVEATNRLVALREIIMGKRGQIIDK
jgi:hypothetical protein